VLLRVFWLPAVIVAVLVLVAVGCSEEPPQDAAGLPPQPATLIDFPAPAGQTLAEMRQGFGPGPSLAPSVQVLEPGENRFGFGLFDSTRTQVAEAPAALYVAPSAGGEAEGPVVATWQSLEVAPQWQSRNVASDPDTAQSFWVARPRFKGPGEYDILAVVRLDGRLVAAEPVKVSVVEDSAVPEIGERAVEISTPTIESAGGNVRSIDTREPPGTMHEIDFADALGKRPVALLFATPALCQTRVCGPVVDIAEQVKASHDGETAFIHMEVYKDNDISKGLREQLVAWHLPTEPWLFTIDSRGRIAARLEGAFSAQEMQAALAAATEPER